MASDTPLAHTVGELEEMALVLVLDALRSRSYYVEQCYDDDADLYYAIVRSSDRADQIWVTPRRKTLALSLFAFLRESGAVFE